METESEPYVRLTTLRSLHRIVADLNAARSLAGTLQAVVEGAVSGLGYQAAAVNLVRPDGDLVVAAVWEVGESGESDDAIGSMLGQIGSRESWDRLLNVGESWGSLVFVPHERAWASACDIPSWGGQAVDEFVSLEADPWLSEDWHPDAWHPDDCLFAPMYSLGGELLGVLSVDRPRNGRRPGAWGREALAMFSQQAGIAIGNARLRAEMQRALVRFEREQQTLRASEESFRQAFEYAPSGMAITELHGVGSGKLTRVNDALCRLLGRPRASLQRHSSPTWSTRRTRADCAGSPPRTAGRRSDWPAGTAATSGSTCGTRWSRTPPRAPASCSPMSRTSRTASGTSSSSRTGPAMTR